MRWKLAFVFGILGLVLLIPFNNYQDFLSQGDHGRDLYAAHFTLNGQQPYHDYWWVYGPLMPYVYSFFYHVGGQDIQTVLITKNAFKLLAAMGIYFSLSAIISLPTAFLGACWFLLFSPDFFFTYNHIGGIAALTLLTAAFFYFITRQQLIFLGLTLAGIFILGLIKINFALSTLVGILLVLTLMHALNYYRLTRQLIQQLILALLAIGLSWALIYAYFLRGLSIEEVRQCLPYIDGDQPYSTTVASAVMNYISITVGNIRTNWMNMCFAGLIVLSVICSGLWLGLKRIPQPRPLLLIFLTLMVLFVFNSHEYLKSGVWYRSFWAQPFSLMLIFLVIDTAIKPWPLRGKCCVWVLPILLMLVSYPATLRHINAIKLPAQELAVGNNRVYLRNQPLWIQTVAQTTQYLNEHLTADELFFALPYDDLYYYLTRKPSPTRQLIFFDHIKITPAQEQKILGELESNHVNYVLISNRAYAHLEPGLGVLGQSYCPTIAQYIHDHFTPVARFGDWTHEPGWAWSHGTLILKRK